MAPARRSGAPLPDDLGYPTIPGPGSMLLPRPPTATAIAEHAAALGTDRILFGTPWPLALLGPRLKRRGFRYAVIVHGAEMLVTGAVPGIRGRLAGALAGAELLLPGSDFTADRIRVLLERKGYDVHRPRRGRHGAPGTTPSPAGPPHAHADRFRRASGSRGCARRLRDGRRLCVARRRPLVRPRRRGARDGPARGRRVRRPRRNGAVGRH